MIRSHDAFTAGRSTMRRAGARVGFAFGAQLLNPKPTAAMLPACRKVRLFISEFSCQMSELAIGGL
jgi:hypothetical protein